MSRHQWRLALIAFLVTNAVPSTTIGNTVAVPLGSLRPKQLPASVRLGGTEDGIAVAGNRAVVTAGSTWDLGRAYVFDLTASGGPSEIAELRASDNHSGNSFGASAAMTNRYVFVGAPGANGDRGAVYMFDLSDPLHIVERKITAFDAAPNNYFGYDLAVSENRLIVAAPKFTAASLPAAAYVIDFTNPNNIQQFKLLATPGSIGGNFAQTEVDISGNYAIVGHISESTQFPFSGAAHLYDISNPSNIRQRRLHATDGLNHHGFGRTVSIDGTRALVSVSSDPGPANLPGAPDGAVWAFDVSNWNQISQHEFGRLPAGNFISPFGRGLDLVGTTATIGAFNEDLSNGAVYVYDVTNTATPKQLARLAAPVGSGNRFGHSLAFDGRSLIIADLAGNVVGYRVVPEPSPISLVVLGVGLTFVSRRRRMGRKRDTTHS